MTLGMNHPADERVRARVDEAIERMVAVASLAAIALIHVLQAPSAFADTGYLGGLFVASVVASVALAAALTVTSDPRVMQASGALAAMLLLGYVLSRTTGLPAFTDDVGEWSEPLGLASMVFEGLLVVVTAGRTAFPGVAGRRVGSTARPIPGTPPGHSAG
jgi:hypothetical protein